VDEEAEVEVGAGLARRIVRRIEMKGMTGSRGKNAHRRENDVKIKMKYIEIIAARLKMTKAR
jgi:hypothetical protein